ncbi:MAG: DUF4159 domain-containing protein [Planctomycetota bacterium]
MAATLGLSPGAARGQDADAPLDPARVLASIDRAVGYLKRQQNGRGAWPESVPGYPGGATSLATLALLNAGVEPGDPAIDRSLEYLRRIPPSKTYVVSLQTMALAEGTPARDRVPIQRNARWLAEAQHTEGRGAGGWGYDDASRERADPSNSQFALLGLYAAQQAGAAVDPKVWELAEAYWRKRQNRDGSWHYDRSENASGSMTCAGIGALVICRLATSSGDAAVSEDGAVACCGEQAQDDAIERGLAWLGRNFSVRGNPTGRRVTQQWHYYYLYALERAGRLSAERLIEQHDWYREGTEFLVRRQQPMTDNWQGRGAGSDPVVHTSFALLFLSKGRRPVVMAKLRPTDAELAPAWAPHRRDAANLTHAAEVAWELPMTWQSIDASRATVDELSYTPVLYASGDAVAGALPEAKKLRAYLDRGGFLLAEAPCTGDAPASRAAIERLVAEVFPEPDYRLRRLEPSHPVWRMERLVSPASPYAGALWGVEYGCRTCVVFCDRDLSCYWELAGGPLRETYPPAARGRIDDAETIGLNVLAYATGREPKGKEQQFVEPTTRVAVEGLGDRGVLQIAKLRHAGGCDDAPGALANLLRVAIEGETRLSLAPTPVEVTPDDPALGLRHLAFAHGRRDFRLSPAERQALGEYLRNGGTLLADAICASPDFARALRREVTASLGGERFERIGADDPLLSDAFGGFDLSRVEVRDPQPVADDQPLAARVRREPPRLEGIRLDGRWAVVFSPLDLSCALEQHEAVQCRGYRQEDAARIGLNVLLYSINQ